MARCDGLKELRLLIAAVADLKKQIAIKQKPLPRISLEVAPTWCRQNPGEAAKTITLLRDALLRTLGHCDRGKHKDNKYRDERDAIVRVLSGD